ncbi:MAG: hypothetical protein ACOCTH_00015 [Halodesulfurarchaeum sp.]
MIAVPGGDEATPAERGQRGRTADADRDATSATAHQAELPPNLRVHVGRPERLIQDRPAQATELLIAPVELHRRNIQRRFREAHRPKDGVQIVDHTTIAERLLESVNRPTTQFDRIDRLSMIETLLADDDVAITSPAVPADPPTIEGLRAEIERLTNFHHERVATLRAAATDLASPIDADAVEKLSAATTVEAALRQRTSTAVSEIELLRRATRLLWADDGHVWADAFPTVREISLVGLSNVSAMLIDLVHAILSVVPVSVSVHMHFRPATGAYLGRRLAPLLDVDEPGAVVFES